MSFADHLKEVRKKNHLSQEELAELLNVSRQAVSKWEQGVGYPEAEKMIVLSQKLNVSLDYLVSGEKEHADQPVQGRNITGKIMIKTHDGKSIVNCYKVMSSPMFNRIFKNKPDEPKYAIFGVDGSSLFGENSTLLGWYADEESAAREVDAILEALNSGKASYELQYAAKVKQTLLSVKLEEKATL